MEEILKSVSEAEREAGEIKAEALARATQIADQAAKCAEEIRKSTESELKRYRETALKEAETRLRARTEETLKRERENAAAEADGLLADTKSAVGAIVRRICDGDSRHA